MVQVEGGPGCVGAIAVTRDFFLGPSEPADQSSPGEVEAIETKHGQFPAVFLSDLTTPQHRPIYETTLSWQTKWLSCMSEVGTLVVVEKFRLVSSRWDDGALSGSVGSLAETLTG